METHENYYYNLTKNIVYNLQVFAITQLHQICNYTIQSKIKILLEMAPFVIDYRLQYPANSLYGGTQLFM